MPLAKKLGLTPGLMMAVLNPPYPYAETLSLGTAPDDCANGIVWVSWPRKASKRHPEVTEETVRRYACGSASSM